MKPSEVPKWWLNVGKPYVWLPKVLPQRWDHSRLRDRLHEDTRRLKELLDLYSVKIGPVVRRTLEEEVRKRALLKIEERPENLAESCSIYPTRKLLGS